MNTPLLIPENKKQFMDFIKKATYERLVLYGFGNWDGSGLMLFPKEWYNIIPNGFTVYTINGNKEKFKKDKTDKDTRYGKLAYGIIVKMPKM